MIAESLREQGLKAANIGGLKDWTAAGFPLAGRHAARVRRSTVQK
jgi:rhodanese-related sulfurtransferase